MRPSHPAVVPALLVVLCMTPVARAQTADDVDKLIRRAVELDSIDITPGLKYRAGLEPSLATLDADESSMKPLENPYEVFGRNTPLAAGWYRVSFTVPEKLGKIVLPKGGFNLGVESNCVGAWEFYAWINGKPAGLWSKDGLLRAADREPTYWMSNAPMPARPGDKITVAILATASPLGRGSPDGYGLRHLRLRFALAHTAARQPFYGGVTRPGTGTGLHGAKEMLATAKGEELAALQARLKGPLDRLEVMFAAAESGKLDDLTKAMHVAAKEINDALKPPPRPAK